MVDISLLMEEGEKRGKSPNKSVHKLAQIHTLYKHEYYTQESFVKV